MANQLKVIDYFDSLVNEVDIKAEQLLAKLTPPYDELEESIEKIINERRRLFIDTIEITKRHNLKCLNQKIDRSDGHDEDMDEKIFEKYCFILDKHDMKMNMEMYMEENDYFFYDSDDDDDDDDEAKINKTFGYLIVLEDGALNRTEFAHFTELLYHRNDKYQYEETIRSMSNKFRQLIDPRRSHSIESNIFNAKLKDVLKHIKVRFGVFRSKCENYIVRTTKSELLRAESLMIGDLKNLFTIKQQAIGLFFKTPISIKIHEYESHYCEQKPNIDINQIVNSLKWYELNLNVKNMTLYLKNDHKIELDDFSSIKSLQEVFLYTDDKHFQWTNLNARLPNLKILAVRSENLTSCTDLDINSLENHINLEELDLSNMHFEKIDSKAFDCLFNLQTLSLNDNNLKSISSLHFKRLSNLVHLDLSGNLIKKIDDGTFSCLSKLKTLNIEKLKLDSISEFLLTGLTSLETLTISSNSISTIHPNAFVQLKQLSILSLGGKLLTSIDAQLFAELTNLEDLEIRDMKFFKFDSIKSLRKLQQIMVLSTNVGRLAADDLSVLSELRKIIFRDCSIQSVEARAFYGLKMLQEIEIQSEKPLFVVDSGAFDGLHSLTSLVLGNCDMQDTLYESPNLKEITYRKLLQIPKSTYSRLTNLQSLRLDNNKIERLDENVFGGLHKLRLLNASKNGVTNVNPNAFQDLNKLKTLNLDQNELKSLSANMFQFAINLVQLDLCWNPIEKIEPGSFRGLENLQRLSLRNGKLTQLPGDAFVGLNNLLWLNLASNKIKSLDENQFNGLANLQCLFLESNEIVNIHTNALDALMKLKELNLSYNKLKSIDGAIFKNLSKLVKLEIGLNHRITLECGTFNSFQSIKF